MATSSRTYTIKETFYSIQGEGFHCGRPAVFLRFTGCNLWSGREEDREDAICSFCDTDFVGIDGEGGGKFATARDLATHVRSFWPDDSRPFVVCTGGEPLLQLNKGLIDALHDEQCEIAVETNGTVHPPDGLDWICVSPKAGSDLVVKSGDELKLVFPQTGAPPEDFHKLTFSHFFLQPMDGPDVEANTKAVLEYCLAQPQWKVSLQVHKLLGVR